MYIYTIVNTVNRIQQYTLHNTKPYNVHITVHIHDTENIYLKKNIPHPYREIVNRTQHITYYITYYITLHITQYTTLHSTHNIDHKKNSNHKQQYFPLAETCFKPLK